MILFNHVQTRLVFEVGQLKVQHLTVPDLSWPGCHTLTEHSPTAATGHKQQTDCFTTLMLSGYLKSELAWLHPFKASLFSSCSDRAVNIFAGLHPDELPKPHPCAAEVQLRAHWPQHRPAPHRRGLGAGAVQTILLQGLFSSTCCAKRRHDLSTDGTCGNVLHPSSLLWDTVIKPHH